MAPSARQLLLAAGAVAAAAALCVGLRRLRRARANPRRPDDPPRARLPSPEPEPRADGGAGAVDSVAEAQRAKDRGNKRFHGKQYKQAIDEYTKAIDLIADDKSNKNLAVYYGNRAQCFYLLEDYQSALADCESSLAIDPTYIKLLIRRAMVHEKLGSLEQSLVDYTAAGLLSQMQNETAMKGCERVVKEVAAAKAQLRLRDVVAGAHASMPAMVQSAPLLHAPQALLAQPMRGLPSPHFISMFISSFKAIRFEDAMEVWIKTAAIIPNDPADPLIAQWRAAVQSRNLFEPGFVHTMVAMFTHLQGRHEEAMISYDRALLISPRHVETLAMRASLFYEKQLLQQAYADFEAAVSADASHPDLYCHRGQLYLLQNQFMQAVSDLREAVRLDPESVLAHVHLGMALHRNNQQSAAIAQFEQAPSRAEVAQFPKSPDVLNYFGELLIELNRLDEASQKIEKAVQLSGGTFPLAYVNQAVLKMTRDDMPGAMTLLQKAIAADPLCETAHVHIAHLHIQSKNLQAAIESYDAAIKLLRVPQELTEAYAMREAVAAQHKLLVTQGEIYEPVMEEFRQLQAKMQAQMMMQQ